MTAVGDVARVPLWAPPESAWEPWQRLHFALAEHGPAPCQTSATPDDWYLPPLLSAAALEACGRCSVKLECLAYAAEAREPGIWGGTTEQERKAMRVGRSA